MSNTDMALLKEGRANFVRGAHYPQDQRWLDRLDMAGFAMWEETLGPGVSVEDMQDWSHFMKYQLQQVEEMLEASMNHPSIMVWAWFNEGPSNHQEACPAYAACARIAGRDPTRLLSWASNKQQDDKCLEYATAVSFNGYPAWYSLVRLGLAACLSGTRIRRMLTGHSSTSKRSLIETLMWLWETKMCQGLRCGTSLILKATTEHKPADRAIINQIHNHLCVPGTT